MAESTKRRQMGFAQAAEKDERHGQTRLRFDVLWIQLQRPPQRQLGFGDLAGESEQGAEVELRIRIS